jgi:hypothetical protein
MNDKKHLPFNLYDNDTERESWVADLHSLERKARQGQASREEHRTIFLLRTQLNLLPIFHWWLSEV